METMQQGAVGVAIKVTIKEDDVAQNVSTVTLKEIVFRKPDGTIVNKTASFSAGGTDGIIQYVTEAAFADVVGVWDAQGNVTFPGVGAFSGRSDVVSFEVLENLA